MESAFACCPCWALAGGAEIPEGPVKMSNWGNNREGVTLGQLKAEGRGVAPVLPYLRDLSRKRSTELLGDLSLEIT